MFAIFLSDKMDPFYQNIGSFPTVIFSFFLGLCVFYWLIAVLGLVDLDIIDIDIPEAEGTFNGADMNLSLAGIMLKLGLHGVPATIIISMLSLFGWMICFLAVHFGLNPIAPSGFLHYVLGAVVFLCSFYLASIPTSWVIRPLRKIFVDNHQDSAKSLTGKVAIVRTNRVDAAFGEAFLNDGGAGLILKVRSMSDEVFNKGDRVVLLEYLEDKNIFHVISEQEFNDVLKKSAH